MQRQFDLDDAALEDVKDSTELIRGLDPEAAQQLLDPALHHMMDMTFWLPQAEVVLAQVGNTAPP